MFKIANLHRARVYLEEIKTKYFLMNIAVCAVTCTKLRLSPPNFSQTIEPTAEVVRPPAEIHAKVMRIYRLTVPLAVKFGAFPSFCVL